MTNFIPTSGILDTARNVNDFVKAHQELFWRIFKPLIPYILALFALDLIVSLLTARPFGLGGLLINYFFAALAISWHRVVLLVPDRAEPMNPLKPRKHELVFMLMGIGIGILVTLIGAVFIGVSAILGPAGVAIGSFVVVPLCLFIAARFSFYFPAKAVDASVSLASAFRQSEGYVLRLLATPFVATFKLILIIIALYIVLGALAGILAGGSSGALLLGLILQLPLLLYFQPLMTVITITVLSNYYQHSLQNPRNG